MAVAVDGCSEVPLLRMRISRHGPGVANADPPRLRARELLGIGRGTSNTLVGEPKPPSEPRPAKLAQWPHRHVKDQGSSGRSSRSTSVTEVPPQVALPRAGQPLPRGPASPTAGAGEAKRLREHRRLREKDEAMQEFVIEGMKGNRFCKVLEDDELEAIFETAEYFRFTEGERVVVQGEVGDYFFVVQSGQLQVKVNDHTTNTLGAGDAFGGVALLHHCPRTATVVAQEECGVWGVERQSFRKILQEHGQRHFAENLRFLDCIALFDGLSAKQKARLCELALVVEGFEANARIITKGEEATAMYVVKKGELSMMAGGTVDASGFLVDGTKVSALVAGDSFGWRAMLYGEPDPLTVVADHYCEVVCITYDQLKQVIGADLVTFLEQSFIHHILRQLPFAGKLPPSQRQRIVQAMEIKSYAGGEQVDGGFGMIAVIEGEMSGTRGGEPLALGRGEACTLDGTLLSLLARGDGRGDSRLPMGLKAGPGGCRAAALRPQRLAKVFKDLGLLEMGSAEGAIGHFELVRLVKEVPIFKELSDSHIDSLVNALMLRRYAKNAQVFRADEVGSSFFIIWSGAVRVLKDGAFVRTLGKGTCFGERALIFEEELRTATVEVSSEGAEIWSVDRQSFRKIITAGMLKQLQHRMKLQDRGVAMKGLRHLRILGAGMFGPVRLVEEMETRTKYALKRIRKQQGGQIPKEAVQEVAVLSAIAETEQPFMLRVVRTFDTAGSFYILTEALTRGSLRDRLPMLGGVLGQWPAQFYAGSLVLALEALHQKHIVHRNVIPENIMLDSQGYIKLVDFGNAKKLDSTFARTYTMAGAPSHMAPEVIRGRGYGSEADLWSLGVTIFELVCGHRPFDGLRARRSTAGEAPPQQSDALLAILEQDVVFPAAYHDEAGKLLIRGLLRKESSVRLGNQMHGWDEVKQDLFFLSHASGDLFGRIANRELVPPLPHPAEQWPDEALLGEQISLSDSEDLGAEKASQAKIRSVFRKFDLNGDGLITAEEMRRVLKRLDFRTYTDEVIDVILKDIDVNHDGSIDYDEFTSWILSSDGEGMRMAMHLEVHE